VQDALKRLSLMIKGIPEWAELERFLPAHLANPTERRAALTSTLLASLEMARDGHVRLHQDRDFGPILVRRGGNLFSGGDEPPSGRPEDGTGDTVGEPA
jgi:segregation and condensation protein A